jgi:hypothetical protein
MKRILFAAALSAMLPASFAMAQDAAMEPAMMMENLTTIQNLVQQGLKDNGIDVDVATLKNSQITEIIGAMTMARSGDMGSVELKGAMEAAIKRE